MKRSPTTRSRLRTRGPRSEPSPPVALFQTWGDALADGEFVSQAQVDAIRGGASNRDLADRSALQPGERAPDAPVVRASSGATTRTFDALYDTRWTLLAFDGGDTSATAAAIGAARVLRDAHPDLATHAVLAGDLGLASQSASALSDGDRTAHTAFRIRRPALYLVRPDGHAALRASITDDRAVWSYLHRTLGTRRASVALGPRGG